MIPLGRKERIAKAATRTASQARGRRLPVSEVEVSDPLVLLELLRIGTARSVGRQFHLVQNPQYVVMKNVNLHTRKEKTSRKRLTIMLYLFPAIAILLALLTAI